MKKFTEILNEKKKEFPSEEQVKKDGKKVFGALLKEVEYYNDSANFIVEVSSYDEIGKLNKMGYKVDTIGSYSNKYFAISV